MSEPCEIRRASDGTEVRVSGRIDQETLDALAARVRAYADSRCKHEGPVTMPEIAQRIHGRKHYVCDREKGHDGAHCWPLDDRDPVAEWTT